MNGNLHIVLQHAHSTKRTIWWTRRIVSDEDGYIVFIPRGSDHPFDDLKLPSSTMVRKVFFNTHKTDKDFRQKAKKLVLNLDLAHGLPDYLQNS
jgi:hypothetical protein